MNVYKCVFVLLFAFIPIVNSQTTAGGWVIENIHGPSQVGIVDTVPVDLNKDGLMDVVSASIEDGHLRAYINQGDLEFEQQYISTDVLGAFRVSATDFNADGEVDFLIPSIETQEIIALIHDPNSQPYGYRKQIIAAEVLLPTDAQAGDFNDDGLMDVVSISFEENVLLLHLQNQQGGFNTTVISSAPQRPRKMVVEDFNNDDVLDILLASEEDNSVRLFSGANGTVFNEILISDQLAGIRFIARCDFPDVEYPNFVAGVTGANQVILFSNEQNNIFNSKIIDNDLPGANAMHCADTDDDGVVELISTAATIGNIYHYQLQGSILKTLVANTRDGYINVSFAAFGKGVQAKIITQAFYESRNLLLDPKVPNAETVVWEDFPAGAYYVDSGDIDNDGDEDIVYAAFREDKVYWAEKQVQGYVIHEIFDGVDGPQSVTISDLDDDGFLDVFSAGAWDNSFWFHRNVGGGMFTTSRITDSANNASRIEVLDVNNDGNLDVIGTSALDDSIRWFDWDGDKFIAEIIDNNIDGARAIFVTDMNGDQFDDMIVGGFFGNTIWLFENNKDGSFSKFLLSTDKIKPTSLLSVDIDGDLDKDILFNSSFSGQIWALVNENDQFEENLIFSRGLKINSMAVIDIDLDSDFDILNVSDRDGDIYISENINIGFDNKVLFNSPLGVRHIEKSEDTGMLPSLILTSDVTNSIKVLRKADLIYLSGFELLK